MATNAELLGEALAIVEAGERAGIELRLAGSAAVLAHAPSAERAYRRSGRAVADIDLVTTSKVGNDAVDELLGERGYEPLAHHNVWHIETRQMFERSDGVHVDVFRDALEFCHSIPVKKRLGADRPTLPLPELLLTKLQIVEVNEKDLEDAVLLLLDHELGSGPDELDDAFLAARLAEDWGFCHTAIGNLEKLGAYLERSSFASGEREVVDGRRRALLDRIEAEPKSSRWRLRAKIGTRKRWYQEVEEAHR